ncbi:Chloride channel protein 2 [Balamuthia mandrillaris]
MLQRFYERLTEPAPPIPPNYYQKLHYRNVDVFSQASTFHPAAETEKLKHASWYARVWAFLMLEQSWLFLIFLGICVALFVITVDFMIEQLILVRDSFTSYTNSFFLNYLLWIFIGMLFSFLAGVCVHLISPHAAGSGIPEMKSILSGIAMDHYLSLSTILAKAIGLVFSIAGGLSVGREGPYVHLAAGVAYQLTEFPLFKRIRKSDALRYQMIAAGCAVGVAVCFGAPIGGVLFSIEVTTTYYLIQNLWKGFFCAVAGSFIARLIGPMGWKALFSTEFSGLPYDPTELVAFAVLAIILGFAAALFTRLVVALVMIRRRYRITSIANWHSRYVQILVIAFLTALFTFPVSAFRGIDVMNQLFSEKGIEDAWGSPNLIFNLAAFIVCKFFLTAVTIGLSLPCGLYTPVFVIGAAFGRLVGEIFAIAVPSLNVVAGGYAVVGAAAFSAGVTRTISTSVIVFELTGQLNHVLPVMVAVLIASAISSTFSLSIYDTLLQLKGLPYMPPFGYIRATNKKAKDIMQQDVVYLRKDSTYTDLARLLETSSHSSYPIVVNKESMSLYGAISRDGLEHMLERHEQKFNAYLRQKRQSAPMGNYFTPIMLSKSSSIRNLMKGMSSKDSIKENRAELPPIGDTMNKGVENVIEEEEYEAEMEHEGSLEDLYEEREKFFAAKITDDFPQLHQRLSVSNDYNDEKHKERDIEDGNNEEEGEGDEEDEEDEVPAGWCIDPCPFQVVDKTPLSKVHFMFSMLGLTHAYVTSGGTLVGIITKRDLMRLTTYNNN